jgi:eukaryotic-like serine/threonine-protein kinase
VALTIGTKIGPYEIQSLLGKGGMGEVYRARDAKLKREVAIKILPEEFSQDPDRVSRFQREAEVLASLTHSNIAAIHDLQEADGSRFLVLELVEGETLADLIARGPLPVDEALGIAKQICEALEAAHDKGIVHRDLKPGNVKILPDGKVKVLDFGLAKALEGAPPNAALSKSPTLSLAATNAGVILGTAAYMSPEQAKGRTVDRRTDIFAFGCVLYEMLAGRAAFEGEDITEILSRVLQREPDWSLLPPDMPQAIRKLLQVCLEKDARKRFRDAADVRLEIELALTAPPEVATVPTTSRARERIWMGVAAMFMIAMAVLTVVHFREVPTSREVLNLSIALPENSTVAHLALSSDGRQLVLALNRDGKTQLWLRSLDSPDLQLLPGTDGARVPFWSPDGRQVGFFADNRLKIVPATGGPPQTLCDEVGSGGGGTWNTEGVILFGSDNGPLRSVSAAGGTCASVTMIETGDRHGLPNFLPDGRHFLYTVGRGEESRRGIYIASLDDPSSRRLLADISSGIFVPSTSTEKAGHVLFLRNDVLMAQAFDPGSLQLGGDAVRVASQGSFSFSTPQVAAAASTNGVLIYLANRTRDYQLTWFDRAGKALADVASPAETSGISLSPDGTILAVGRAEQGLWLREMSRGGETRFTFPPLLGNAPVWSPDGKQIVFSSNGNMYRKDTAGGGEAEPLPTASPRAPSDWSRAGRFLIYTENNPKTLGDLWLLSTEDPSKKPLKFLQTEFTESQAQFSPDGRWVAYTSNESGANEIYVRPFPSGTEKLKVSSDGGREPRWRQDGKELFYMSGSGDRHALVAVKVQAGPGKAFDVGVPQKLFDFSAVAFLAQLNYFLYSPSPDGQRFLVNVNASSAQPTLNIMVNWEQATAR